MTNTGRRGEAPLPLILAGAATLTAILVIVGGLLTRKSDAPPPPSPGGGKYIQSLEGVMESFDRKGRPAATATERAVNTGSSSAGAAPALAATALHRKMMSLVAAPDILIRRLGHRDGDFVFSKQRGWLKFDPATNALRPIAHAELPQDLKDRYPAELYPSRGKVGRRPDEERQKPDGYAGAGGGRGGSGYGLDGGPFGSAGAGGGGAGGANASGAGTAGGAGASGAGGAGGAGGAVPLTGVGDEVVFRETPVLAPAAASP